MKSLSARFISQRFTAYAILFILLFAGAHLLGFREYTGILSGTASLDQYHQYYGVLYILLYVNFVVIVPVLLIASVLTEIWTFFMLKED
ncbi:hypothetical protein VU04_02795 [Desulfobulbus sp. TB]|nr:hypothetical protein [Desulfobulbus sp. TB]